MNQSRGQHRFALISLALTWSIAGVSIQPVTAANNGARLTGAPVWTDANPGGTRSGILRVLDQQTTPKGGWLTIQVLADKLVPGRCPGAYQTFRFTWEFADDPTVIMFQGPRLNINFKVELVEAAGKCAFLNYNPRMTVAIGNFGQKPVYGQHYYCFPGRNDLPDPHTPNPFQVWANEDTTNRQKQLFDIVMDNFYDPPIAFEMHVRYNYEGFQGTTPTPPKPPQPKPPVPPSGPGSGGSTGSNPGGPGPGSTGNGGSTSGSGPGPGVPGGTPTGSTPPPPVVGGTDSGGSGTSGGSAQSGMIIEAEKRSVAAGGLVVVPVWLKNAADLANMNFTVSYSDSVIRVEGDSRQGSIDGNAIFAANPQQSGMIRVGFAQTSGINGTGTVVLLPFRAVGQPGARSPLHLEVTTINNPAGATLKIARIDGWVRIVDKNGLIPGDCDGDGVIKTNDAMCALKMSVQLIPVQSQMDIDRDGQVTSRDATLILQQALGLSMR